MKALSPIMKNLPVTQVLEVVTLVLNHSANMQKIKLEYKYAKKEMKHRFTHEKLVLENDLQRFTLLAKLQRKQFSDLHKERLQLLESVNVVAKAMSHTPEPEILSQTIEMLMDKYQQSLSLNLNSTQLRLGAQ